MADKEIPSKLLRVGISPMLQHRLLAILDQIQSHDDAGPFLQPVDPDALGIPHYRDVIKHPMDLGTVQRRLEDGEYDNLLDFASDIRLVWRNCLTFNQNESSAPLRRMARTLGALFEALLEDVVEDVRPGSLAKAGFRGRAGRSAARSRPRRTTKRAAAAKPVSLAENSDDEEDSEAGGEGEANEDEREENDSDDGLEDDDSDDDDDDDDEGVVGAGRRAGSAGRAARRAQRAEQQHHHRHKQPAGQESGLLFQPDFVIANPEVASAVADVDVRDVFWKELQQVLRRKKMASAQRKPPILCDKPLDLWLVWNFVQLWGGHDAMCKEMNQGSWLEVFRQLPNNDGSEQEGAAQLRKCYERYLLPYERTYHSDLGKRVAEGIDPRVALRGVTVAAFPAATVVAPATHESARPHWGTFSVCLASGTVLPPPAKRRAITRLPPPTSHETTGDDDAVCSCHMCGRTVLARHAARMGYRPLDAAVRAQRARQAIADEWADGFVGDAWSKSALARVPQADPRPVQSRPVRSAVDAHPVTTSETGAAFPQASPTEATPTPGSPSAADEEESGGESEGGIARSRPRRERKTVVPFGCMSDEFGRGRWYRHRSGRAGGSMARPRLAHETVPTEPLRETESSRLDREAAEDQEDAAVALGQDVWRATTRRRAATTTGRRVEGGDEVAWEEAWKQAMVAAQAAEERASHETEGGRWMCGACADRPTDLTRTRRSLRRDARWIQEQPVPTQLVAVAP